MLKYDLLNFLNLNVDMQTYFAVLMKALSTSLASKKIFVLWKYQFSIYIETYES